MFIDKARIKVKAGNGGDGAVSFLREKYIIAGGPDGGDGGKGGDIILTTTTDLNTLMDLRYQKQFKAKDGDRGGSKNCTGKSAPNIEILVPMGTIVREGKTGKIMADLSEENQSIIIAEGGKGGKGNQHFATSRRQAPRYSERGRQGQSYQLILELKLIADVGLIGLPNVGKSSILAMATNANPKIANYHFTTLAPNLGVVRQWDMDYVIADIPGLIEGASEGIGLGTDFLRHVERTKVLVHVVDAAGIEGNDPIEDIEILNNELEQYNPELLKRPMVIAANKMDIPEAEENYKRLKEKFEPKGIKVFPTSAVTNKGIKELLEEITTILKDYPDDIVFEKEYDEYVEIEKEREPFKVYIDQDGMYIVEGVGVEKMIGYTNLDTEKGFAFFQNYIKEKGIVEALVEAGIQDGDVVQIYDLQFDYYK